MCVVIGHRGTGSGGNPGGPSVSPTGGTSEPPPGEHDSGPPQGHSATTCFAPLKLLFRIKQSIVDSHELGPPGDQDAAAGDIALRGYVPRANLEGGGTGPSPTSGVTIGFGVDLHANDSPGILEAYPYLVPKGIVDQIAPAMGYVGQAAQDYLNAQPVALSLVNAQTLSTDVFFGIFDQLSNAFDSQSTLGLRYENLPSGAQTALMDLGYNYGPNLSASGSSTVRNIWSSALAQNWQQVQADFDALAGPNPSKTSRWVWDAGAVLKDVNNHFLPAGGTHGLCSNG